MSPRKSRNGRMLPEWVVQSIRMKRKKLLHGPYDCPKCGKSKLRILLNKEMKEVIGICVCGLKHPLKYVQSYELIDYYNKLIDQFYEKK